MLRKAARGFTLIELMIVVAIIGILAAIAIPNFLKYQLRSKSGEAPVHLAAIKTSELAYYGSHDGYVTAAAAPREAASTDSTKIDWNNPDDWKELGWQPEGPVYFSYAVAVTTDSGGAFTAEAVGNLDADTDFQCWLFQKSDNAGGVDAGADGSCDETLVRKDSIGKASLDGVY